MKKKIANGFIDIHSHIVPDVDDGSPNMGVSMEMLDIAYKEGIRTIVATPHFHPGKSMIEYANLREKFLQFKEAAMNIHPDMKLYLGREVYYTSDVMELIEHGSNLTIESNKYILVEYSPRTDYNYIRMSVNNMVQAGLIPIIAHVERYICILEDIDRVEELRDMGAIIQVNTASILGLTGRAIKKYTKMLLKNGLIDLVATDAHSAGTRAPRMRECADYIVKKYGLDYAEDLLLYNPERIIEGRYLEETD